VKDKLTGKRQNEEKAVYKEKLAEA